MRGLEPLGEDIRRELGRLGPAGAIADVVAVWPDAVGPAIAANAWPARISRDGTLHVATRSSTWAFELTQLSATIQERLAADLDAPGPTALRFAPGRLPEPGAETVAGEKRTVPTPSRAALAAGEEIASGIADPALREAVARAAAASLGVAEAGPSDRRLW
jgi:predicted nucleic acid-binding Zn ribbon protein